jgi:hypothetical protein
MTYTYVFVLGFCIDYAYTAWVRNVGGGQRAAAALWSMGIGACGALGLTAVVGDHMLLLPYVLGLGAGTYFATGGEQ